MSDESFNSQIENPKPVEPESLQEQWDAFYVRELQAAPDRTTYVQGIAHLAAHPDYTGRHAELRELYETLKLADHQKRRGEYLPITWPEKFRSLVEQFISKPGGEELLPSSDSQMVKQAATHTQAAEISAQPESAKNQFEKEVKEELRGLLTTVESIDGLLVALEDRGLEVQGAASFGTMSEEKRDETHRQITQAQAQLDFYTTQHLDKTLHAPDGPFSVGDITNFLKQNKTFS